MSGALPLPLIGLGIVRIIPYLKFRRHHNVDGVTFVCSLVPFAVVMELGGPSVEDQVAWLRSRVADVDPATWVIHSIRLFAYRVCVDIEARHYLVIPLYGPVPLELVACCD